MKFRRKCNENIPIEAINVCQTAKQKSKASRSEKTKQWSPLDETTLSNLSSTPTFQSPTKQRKKEQKNQAYKKTHFYNRQGLMQLQGKKGIQINKRDKTLIIVIGTINAQKDSQSKAANLNQLIQNKIVDCPLIFRAEQVYRVQKNKLRNKHIQNILKYQAHKLTFDRLNQKIKQIKLDCFSTLQVNCGQVQYKPFFVTLLFLLSRFQIRWREKQMTKALTAMIKYKKQNGLGHAQ